MNIDFKTLIIYFIGAFACCSGMFCTCKILLFKSIKEIKIWNYLLILLFSFFLILNSLLFDNILKMIGSLLILYLICRIIFTKSKSESLLFAIAAYIIFLLGETTYALIISLIDLIFEINFSSTAVKSILANFIISVFACFYALIFKKFIAKSIKQLKQSKLTFMLILGILTIIIILSSIYILYSNKWLFNFNFILNLIIIIGCVYLFSIILKEDITNKELTKKYNLLIDYLKTSAEFIEKYSTVIHKYKNNLIIIKSYIKRDAEEAEKYIDELLEDCNATRYNWFLKINHIKMDTIRYLIYYKLSKAENNKLKIFITVGNDIKKFTNGYLTNKQINLTAEIFGEYFDNAIYAATESRKKELNLNIYLDNNQLVFELANTYKNDFSLDLIFKNGYTTKGKGHGLGLCEVNKRIKKANFLKSEYTKTDEYFIVKMKVK